MNSSPKHAPFKIFRVTGMVTYTTTFDELVIGSDRIDAQLRMITRAKAEAAARMPKHITLEKVHVETCVEDENPTVGKPNIPEQD